MSRSEAAESRPLTDREEALLVAMITSGASALGGDPVSAEDRAWWLERLSVTRAGHACGCGTCPSVELIDATWSGSADQRSHHVVVEASTPGAVLLLHVDDDRRLSYLELAPVDDAKPFTEFPAVGDVDFS